MRQLTESLLTLARFDASRDAGVDDLQRVDLAASARVCLDLVRPLAGEWGIQFLCDLAPAPVLGKDDQLQRLVTHLLVNAIQYKKTRGEVRVSTSVHGSMAVLAVSDTGQGISDADLPHVFERFYRAHPHPAGCRPRKSRRASSVMWPGARRAA